MIKNFLNLDANLLTEQAASQTTDVRVKQFKSFESVSLTEKYFESFQPD